MQRLLCIWLACISAIISIAQTNVSGASWWNTEYNTTEGTEFWVTFMRNSGSAITDDHDMKLYLYATARQNTTITISNPNLSLPSITFTVQANRQDSILIPNAYAYIEEPYVVQDLGIYIQSTNPVSIYSTSHHSSGKYDGSNILPIATLEREYILQTFKQDVYATEFAVVATEDGQVINLDIIETTATNNPQTTRKTEIITLQRGQTYFYRSQIAAASLSGTHLCSSSPFALFQGGQSAKIINDPENHIFHQATPDDQFGKKFVVVPTATAKKDYVRITAAYPNTTIKEGSSVIRLANSGDTYQKEITSPLSLQPDSSLTQTPTIIYYEANKEVTMYHYASGYTQNSPNCSFCDDALEFAQGAPTMSPIIPQEYGMKSCAFATLSEGGQKMKHYVNIVAPTSEVSTMYLDGTNISSHFIQVPNSSFSYATLYITNKAHFLQNRSNNVNATFTARVYGVGIGEANDGSMSREAYSYSVGSRVDRSVDMLINDQYIKEITICKNKSLKFTSIINYNFDSRLWDFGDGTTYTDSIVSAKKWNEAGDYEVHLIVTKHTPLCNYILTDTVKAMVHVKDVYNTNVQEKLCNGETYTISGRGANGQIITRSYTTNTYKDEHFYTVDGCDSIVHIDIQFGNPTQVEKSMTVCDSIIWNGIKYTKSGRYKWIGKTIYGCDSTVYLNLTINHSVHGNSEKKTICEGSTLEWNGLSIDKAGLYTVNLTAANGCDSICSIKVDVEKSYKDEISILRCPNETYVWRGETISKPDTYTRVVKSTTSECDSTFILHFSYYPTYDHTLPINLCEGEIYQFGDTLIQTSGTYTRHFQSVYGCDSLVTLKVMVHQHVLKTIDETICSNDTYTFAGKKINKTGVYTVSDTTQYGCDSITTLKLTVLPTTTLWDTVTICDKNLPYTYAPQSVARGAGDYTYTYVQGNQYGCDSVYHLHLIVLQKIITNLDAVYRCDYEGEYNHPDKKATHLQHLNATGVYKDTLLSQNGCDSILILPFYWGTRTYNSLNISECDNNLPWRDANNSNLALYRDTIYNDTIPNILYCDSIITVHFKVLPTYTQIIDTMVCELELPFNYPDIRFTTLQKLTKSGTYHQVLPSINGCDSSITLNLKINPTTYHKEYITECESNLPYIYGEHNKQAIRDGIYYDTLSIPNQYGCDSILEVHLSVLTTIRDIQYDTICSSEIPYEHLDKRALRLQNLMTTGVYYDTLKNSRGCDSILELHLFVPPAYYGLEEELELCDNQYVRWNDKDIYGSWGVGDTLIIDTLSTMYGCDSVIALTVHIYPTYMHTQNIMVCQNREQPLWDWLDEFGHSHGKYPIDNAGHFIYGDTLPTIHGCDSVFGINLVVNPTYYHDSVYHICENERISWQGKWYAGDSALVLMADHILSPGLYHDTVQYVTNTGCDSIFYLQLHVHPIYNIIVDMDICADELPYLIYFQDQDTLVVDTLQLKPTDKFRYLDSTCKDTLYRTYTRTLRTIHHCDSVVHWNITIHPSYEYIESAKICWDSYYTWRGRVFTETGVYTDSLKTKEFGCDSVYVLELFVKPIELIRVDTSICDNEILYQIDTLWYDENWWREVTTVVWQPGMSTLPPYWDLSFKGKDGCDSIVYRYYIDIHPTYLMLDTAFICSNEVYQLHDSRQIGLNLFFDQQTNVCVLPFDTILADTLSTLQYGCDSVYQLHAHIYPAYLHVDSVDICQFDTAVWRNNTYFEGSGTNQFMGPGDWIYQDKYSSIHGCDSIYELHLHVRPEYDYQVEETICRDDLPFVRGNILVHDLDLQRYDSVDHTAYYDSVFYYKTMADCDSIVRLSLQVLDTTSEVLVDTFCYGDTYYLHDMPIVEPGNYKDTTLNAWGCHHFTYLSLFRIEPTQYQIYFNNEVCLDEETIQFSYDYQGQSLISFAVLFDSLGHSQGFEDIYDEALDTVHQAFSIPLPYGSPLPHPTPTYFDSRKGVNRYVDEDKYEYPQPNDYPVRIILRNGICSDNLMARDTIIHILYPAWIHEQHWNDGIVLYNELYNGGYTFSRYQWYHNDEPIIGQTREFLYLPDTLVLNDMGQCDDYYQVRLTRESDNYTTFTCPICPVHIFDTIVPQKDYMSVVPTLVVRQNPTLWILSTMKGHYTILTLDGIILGRGLFIPDANNYAGTITLPTSALLYNYVMIRLDADNGEYRSQKILITNGETLR